MLSRRSLLKGLIGAALFPSAAMAAAENRSNRNCLEEVPFGPFRVGIGGKIGFMDNRGNVVVPIRFEDALWFSEGSGPVVHRGRWGYIDHHGDWVIEPQWKEATVFRCGLGAVRGDDGWVVINRRGKAAFEGKFRNPPQFSEGFAAARRGGSFGYLDTAGRFVIPPAFPAEDAGGGSSWYTASPFSEGLASIRVPGGLHGFIDTAGRFAVPPMFCGTEHFQEGLAAVMLPPPDCRWIYINVSGEAACGGRIFSEANPFSEGVAAVHARGHGWGFIDRHGDWAIEPRKEFLWAREFSEGLASIAFRRGGIGYIDRSGNVRIPPKNWSWGGRFEGGTAPVQSEGDWRKWGYIDTSGKYIWEPTA